MLGIISRTAVKNIAIRGARALGAAVVAGIGWKLGNDAYDAVKRRLKREAPDRQKNP